MLELFVYSFLNLNFFKGDTVLDYQFTCKCCGRTTFCNYDIVTQTYGNRVITREECSHCGYICYNCRQLNDAREATIRKNQIVDDGATFNENLIVDDEIVNQDAELA